MTTTIFLPTALQQYANQADAFTAEETGTVGQALERLVTTHRALRQHLFDDTGKLRSFVNVFVNDEDIRGQAGLDTPLNERDEIAIIPSVAGGADLSKEEMERYSRHVIMPEVGVAGQKQLKDASVLLIGMGGLGSPLGLYLAAAGVGRLAVVDMDRVDTTNLQRQIIYTTADVGQPKAAAAKAHLQAMNPHIVIDTYETHFTSANAMEIAQPYDIVIDGTDNFPTRYLVNDVCVLLGKPNVYGSIFRFEGQASVFDAKIGPCYRCLYPEPPPPGLVPSCAEGGVLGILPGLIGVLQATEAVKIILGKPDTLVGRLLVFNALKMRFRELKLRKDESCPICGPHATITELIDYQEFCGMPNVESPMHEDVKDDREGWEISVQELEAKLKAGGAFRLIDVREPHEWEICHIDGAELMPLSEFDHHVSALDKNQELLIQCRSGGRSWKALMKLREQGFTQLKNVSGGILAWANEIDDSMPTY